MRTWYDKWRDLVSSAIFYAGVVVAFWALVHFGSGCGFYKIDEQFRQMDPKVTHGDYVRVNKRVTSPDELHYADIVMYRVPVWKRSSYAWECARVVGKPGDLVELKDHRLWRAERRADGKLGSLEKVDEPYLRPGMRTTGFSPFVVPRNCVFVLYDERSRREPLRNFIVPERSIRGRVMGR